MRFRVIFHDLTLISIVQKYQLLFSVNYKNDCRFQTDPSVMEMNLKPSLFSELECDLFHFCEVWKANFKTMKEDLYRLISTLISHAVNWPLNVCCAIVVWNSQPMTCVVSINAKYIIILSRLWIHMSNHFSVGVFFKRILQDSKSLSSISRLLPDKERATGCHIGKTMRCNNSDAQNVA